MNQANQAVTAEQPDRYRRRPLRRIVRDWRLRHRHPFNFWIHMLGIPLAVAGVVLLFFTDWYWGLSALVIGYVLQYWGHSVEGNDVGEWAAVKRLLGLPYVGIAPQYASSTGAAKNTGTQ
jgi:hypothetical protein